MDIKSQLNSILNGLKIKGECIAVRQHRHLVFCEIILAPGQKVRKLETSAREIGLALKAKTTPIISVNSEKGVVSIQFAVRAADVLSFEELWHNHINAIPKGILPYLIGEQGDGQPLWVDMAMNPHLLIAGGTGSGKSSLLHLLIMNSILRDDVWLYLVDPKGGVEFGLYENKYCNFLAKDYHSALSMLNELAEEMERRYEQLRKYNISSIEQSPYIFPKILVVIDEVADLMMQDQNKRNPHRGLFESQLCTIAQKSRAAGIYLVLATQRPSVDVITGLIKANFPARIACKVSSGVDSKVILDQPGAESLLGRGDGIINAGTYNYVRFQAAYISPMNNRVAA